MIDDECVSFVINQLTIFFDCAPDEKALENIILINNAIALQKIPQRLTVI